MRIADPRRAVFSLAAGIAVSLIGVAALARSYPWLQGYSLLEWVTAPVPLALYGIFRPTVWLLNVLLWAAFAWACPSVVRTIIRGCRATQRRWSSPFFRKFRRVLAGTCILGAVLFTQYVAVSNTPFVGSPGDDTGVWRFRSLVPLGRQPWWQLLEVLRPVLIQPLATPVRYAFRHLDVVKGTFLGRWLMSSQGLAEGTGGRWTVAPGGMWAADRWWDLQFTVINSAVWLLLAFGLYRVVRLRFASLSPPGYGLYVLAAVIAMGGVHYGWHRSPRWAGAIAARWDAHSGRLAFCVWVRPSHDERTTARLAYVRALQKNLCGVDFRPQGRGPRAAEYALGYNLVMEREAKRRLGPRGLRDCSDRAFRMMMKKYR
jgi:hypothetical protein